MGEFENRFNYFRENRMNSSEEFEAELDLFIKECKKNKKIDVQIKSICVKAYINLMNNNLSMSEKLYRLAIEKARIKGSLDLIAYTISQLGTYYWNISHYSQAAQFFKDALEKMELIHDYSGIAQAKMYIGASYLKKGELQEAFNYLHHAVLLSDFVADLSNRGAIFYWIGKLYLELDLFEQTTNSINKSNDLFIESDDKEWQYLNHMLTGDFFRKTGEIENALESYLSARKYASDNKKDELLAETLTSISEIYELLGNFSESLANMEKAVVLFRKSTDIDKLILSLNKMIQLLLRQNNSDKALKYLQEIEDLTSESKNKELNYLAYYSLALYNCEVQDYKKAVKMAHKSLKYAEQLASNEYTVQTYSLLVRCYDEMKSFRQAFQNSVLKEKANENLFKDELSHSLKIEKAKTEILKLKKENEEKAPSEKIRNALKMAITVNQNINQPLMTIQGNLELFLSYYENDDLPEKQQKHLNRIYESLNQIHEILVQFKEERNIIITECIREEEGMAEFEEE